MPLVTFGHSWTQNLSFKRLPPFLPILSPSSSPVFSSLGDKLEGRLGGGGCRGLPDLKVERKGTEPGSGSPLLFWSLTQGHCPPVGLWPENWWLGLSQVGQDLVPSHPLTHLSQHCLQTLSPRVSIASSIQALPRLQRPSCLYEAPGGSQAFPQHTSEPPLPEHSILQTRLVGARQLEIFWSPQVETWAFSALSVPSTYSNTS